MQTKSKCFDIQKVSLQDIGDFSWPLISMFIIFLTGESPLEAAERVKNRTIAKMLKKKQDEELDLIAEVGNMNYETFVDLIFTPSCF